MKLSGFPWRVCGCFGLVVKAFMWTTIMLWQFWCEAMVCPGHHDDLCVYRSIRCCRVDLCESIHQSFILMCDRSCRQYGPLFYECCVFWAQACLFVHLLTWVDICAPCVMPSRNCHICIHGVYQILMPTFEVSRDFFNSSTGFLPELGGELSSFSWSVMWISCYVWCRYKSFVWKV